MVNKSVSATSFNKCAAFNRANESFHLALCIQARIGRLAVFPPALVEESLMRIQQTAWTGFDNANGIHFSIIHVSHG